MTSLTPEQEAIKRAVLHEVAQWLGLQQPRGLYLLKTRQVIRMLNISRTTLSRLRRSGALQAKKIGKSYRYTYPDILELLEKRSGPSLVNIKIK